MSDSTLAWVSSPRYVSPVMLRWVLIASLCPLFSSPGPEAPRPASSLPGPEAPRPSSSPLRTVKKEALEALFSSHKLLKEALEALLPVNNC